MRKLIVGCGYLGRRVARAWMEQGHEIVALTRSPATAERFRSSGWEALIGDVTRPQTLRQLPPAATVLYAVGFDRRSDARPEQVYLGGLRNVLDRLADYAERFLYVSSTSVYGQCQGEWVDELSPCEPAATNGQVALAAEQLLRERLPQAIILRLAGLYGPGRILSKADKLRAGVLLTGRSDAWLNLIHVDDAVQAVLAAEDRARPGEMCLVCDDVPVQRADYYGTLAKLVGAPPPIFDASRPARRGSGPLNKRCCNRKLREQLGVDLRYPSYREGLRQALQAEQFMS